MARSYWDLLTGADTSRLLCQSAKQGCGSCCKGWHCWSTLTLLNCSGSGFFQVDTNDREDRRNRHWGEVETDFDLEPGSARFVDSRVAFQVACQAAEMACSLAAILLVQGFRWEGTPAYQEERSQEGSLLVAQGIPAVEAAFLVRPSAVVETRAA